MKRKKSNLFIILFLAGIMSFGSPRIVSAHTYTQETRIDPTCTDAGKIIHQCIYCDLYYEDILPALGHDYQISEETEATCEEEGHITYTCSRCDDSYEERIPAIGHDFQLSDSREAGCEEDGYETYTCSHCKDSYIKEIPAIGHDYQLSDSRQADCESKGYEIYTCSHCKDSYTKEIPATGHDYRLTDSVDATTTTEGYQTYICSLCQKTYTQTIPRIEIEKPSQPEKEEYLKPGMPTKEEANSLQSATEVTMETSIPDITENIEIKNDQMTIFGETDIAEEKTPVEKDVSSQVKDEQNTHTSGNMVSTMEISVGKTPNQINIWTGLLTAMIFAVYGGGGVYIFSFRHLSSWIKKEKKRSFEKLYGGDKV